MDNRRFFAFLLLGLSIFLIMRSYQDRENLANTERAIKEKEAVEARNLRRQKLAELEAELKKNQEANDPGIVPRKKYVLGTMNPSDGYSLLVTLDSKGAGIERIELVERKLDGKFKYRSLQDKELRGYAGHLSIELINDKLEIQTVPPGSPASVAKCVTEPNLVGLQPGDVLIGWDSLEGVPSIYKLDKWIDKWRVGDVVSLSIEREGKPFQFEVKLEEKPLDIVRAEDDFAAEQVIGNDPTLSCLTTLAKIDDLSIEAGETSLLGLESTLEGNWESKPLEVDNGMGVEFSKPLKSLLGLSKIDADIKLVKQYRLKKKPSAGQPSTVDSYQYHLELTTTVRNDSDKPHTISLRQDGFNGISLEAWWYPTKISPYFFSGAGARDIIVSDEYAPHTLTTTRTIVSNAIADSIDNEMELFGPANKIEKRSLHYIGLDTQSFTAAFLPSETTNSLKDLERGSARVINSAFRDPKKLPSSKQQACNVGFWIESKAEMLAPQSSKSYTYVLFAGPKDPDILAAYKLDEAIEYGWDIFGFFAKRLGWILHGFYSVVGFFGIAIIMLTVLVRSLMFPISRKMAINAQKMQSVQPHMTKLRETFKEDPRKMMAAQQMLMKKAGINQLAGCLPALIQLPIVIGLYRCVSVDIELRQKPLIPGWEWCSNLAGPDMLVDWHSWMPDIIAGRGTGFFGPYFNILPIITITLFIIQQKVLMPKATDEQTAVAQKMMMVMTVAMGVLFFRVPAGLCIYFITSSTWSLVERMLIKRFAPKNVAVELPEGTAMEIITAVNKISTNPTASRQTPNTKSNSDRPKLKNQKPPETLAELFPKWFGPKTPPSDKGGKSSSKKK